MADHFRKLERMYHAAPISELYSPRLEVSEGRAIVTLPVEAKFYHAAGALHGSVYFKALDDAAFFAVSSVVREAVVVTVSFNLYLLRPIVEGTLRAEGSLTSSSRNLFTADAVLYLDGDRQVARGSGTFMRSRIRLDSVDSYAGDEEQ